MQEAKRLFKKSAILFAVLLILLYFGSFLKYLLNNTWYGTGTIIAVIFIWVTVFTIMTMIASKAVTILKQELRGKERLDFVAKLGSLIIDYKISNKETMDFFRQVCEENGIMEPPDLNKYIQDNELSDSGRDAVFEILRTEIEHAADAHSQEKIS